MDAVLSIRSDEYDAEGLQRVTEDLCRALNRETDIAATVAVEPEQSGTKGDMLTVGTIILALLGGRGVGRALVEVLNTYVGRGRHLEIEIKAKGGEIMKFKGDHLTPDELQQMTKLANEVLGASE